MSDIWQRKRQPDEVPTPLAVALSDYCRRAKAPASPTEVREALSLVAPEEEFRVRQLTDAEPQATPLGPFAAIDVLLGTAPQTAAQRQQVGFYELARSLAATRAAPAPVPVSAEAPSPAPVLQTAERLKEFLGPAQEARKGKHAKAKDEVPMSERIAPRRRGPLEPAAPEPTNASAYGHAQDFAEDDEHGPSHRERQAPRGRFAQLHAPRQPASALLTQSARPTLEAMLEQHPHRLALHKALASLYSGRKGPLTPEDVTLALSRHGLLETLHAKERELILGSYGDNRGATGRVAWALGLSPSELRVLVQAAGLEKEVDQVRERFKRETLASGSLAHRLELVARAKYLDDLGVRRQFMNQLEKELRPLLTERVSQARSLGALVEDVARRAGVEGTSLRRAMDRLDLSEEFEQRVAGGSAARAH